MLASDVDSTEFSVEAMLCLDAERRIPAGWEMLARLGFGVNDLAFCDMEPAHSLPKNREAAAVMPVETPCDWW